MHWHAHRCGCSDHALGSCLRVLKSMDETIEVYCRRHVRLIAKVVRDKCRGPWGKPQSYTHLMFLGHLARMTIPGRLSARTFHGRSQAWWEYNRRVLPPKRGQQGSRHVWISTSGRTGCVRRGPGGGLSHGVPGSGGADGCSSRARTLAAFSDLRAASGCRWAAQCRPGALTFPHHRCLPRPQCYCAVAQEQSGLGSRWSLADLVPRPVARWEQTVRLRTFVLVMLACEAYI